MPTTDAKDTSERLLQAERIVTVAFRSPRFFANATDNASMDLAEYVMAEVRFAAVSSLNAENDAELAVLKDRLWRNLIARD